jgi:hypothetical protein
VVVTHSWHPLELLRVHLSATPKAEALPLDTSAYRPLDRYYKTRSALSTSAGNKPATAPPNPGPPKEYQHKMQRRSHSYPPRSTNF